MIVFQCVSKCVNVLAAGKADGAGYLTRFSGRYVLDLLRCGRPVSGSIWSTGCSILFQTDVLAADGPVLVGFWAEWCGPCHAISPALEQLADELGGKVTVVKMNFDENPGAPGRYAVHSIPTMILFKDGAAAATHVGNAPKSQIKAFIAQAIG